LHNANNPVTHLQRAKKVKTDLEQAKTKDERAASGRQYRRVKLTGSGNYELME
jgi:hypothetical protein